MGKDPSRAAPSFLMSREANKDAVERWSKTVVRFQGVDRDYDFEVRRLGALPSCAASQGLQRESVPCEAPLEWTRTPRGSVTITGLIWNLPVNLPRLLSSSILLPFRRKPDAGKQRIFRASDDRPRLAPRSVWFVESAVVGFPWQVAEHLLRFSCHFPRALVRSRTLDSRLTFANRGQP